jgi:hypothetical protein
MAKCRQDVVMMAFRKLDKTNDGVIKVDDLYNVYSVERNAKFISGEMTKEDIFKEFLKNFESGSHPDGIVGLFAGHIAVDHASFAGDERGISQLLLWCERID